MTSLLDARLRAVTADSPVALRVVYADGSGFAAGAGSGDICIRFKTVGAQWRCLVLGHVGLLEAWFDGDVEIDGDLAPPFALGFEAGYDAPTLAVRLLNGWHEMRRNNASRVRAKRNARAHYGLGDAFYQLWLDRDLLMYTCAFWQEGTRSLEEAQRAKVDHVCRKLMLARGDSVVDIGCGFGGFMFHAAEHYGVSVEGVNTTTEQVAWLDAEIDRRKLRSTLSVREADFRDVARQYDKVVSIGVLEHAGRDQIDVVVQVHADSLAPGGKGRRTPATYPMSRAFLYQEPPIRRTQPELRHVA